MNMKNDPEKQHEEFQKTLDEMGRINDELANTVQGIARLRDISEIMKERVSAVAEKLDGINISTEMITGLNERIDGFGGRFDDIDRLIDNVSSFTQETSVSDLKGRIDSMELSVAKFGSSANAFSEYMENLKSKSDVIIGDFDHLQDEIKNVMANVEKTLGKHGSLFEEERRFLDASSNLHNEMKNTVQLDEINRLMMSSRELLDSNMNKLNDFMSVFAETGKAVSSYEEIITKLVSETAHLQGRIESLETMKQDKLHAAVESIDLFSKNCLDINKAADRIEYAAVGINKNTKSVRLFKYPKFLTVLVLMIFLLQAVMSVVTFSPDLLRYVGLDKMMNRNEDIIYTLGSMTREIENLKETVAGLDKTFNDINSSVHELKNTDIRTINDNISGLKSEVANLGEEKIGNISNGITQVNEKLKQVYYNIDELNRLIKKK